MSKVGIFGARRASTKLANKSGRPKTLQTYFSNCWSLPRESSIHSGTAAPRSCRRRASSRSEQHCLYLLPLPQWHASLRPRRGGGRTTSLTLSEISWFRVRPMVSQKVPRTGCVAGRSFLLGLLHGLSTQERQQLSVGGKDLGN